MAGKSTDLDAMSDTARTIKSIIACGVGPVKDVSVSGLADSVLALVEEVKRYRSQSVQAAWSRASEEERAAFLASIPQAWIPSEKDDGR